MKEIVILSGKGGTGKTSISAALAALAPHKTLADCDVDAANFHLISGAVQQECHSFTAGFEPHTILSDCIQCGRCTETCRFSAITDGIITSPFACEGCGVCAYVCPTQAIRMEAKAAGHWFISKCRWGTLVHADLGIAVENSGKLVSKVRQEAKVRAQQEQVPLIITDGPPGVGCPTIAALTGAHLVLAVIEPTVSGIHDAQRLVTLDNFFSLPIAICINKCTLHTSNTEEITAWCQQNKLPVIAQVPYSDIFRIAVQQGNSILDFPDTDGIQAELKKFWHHISNLLQL